MSLPPLASIDDLRVRLADPLDGSDVARAEAALVDASALVRTEARKTWLNDDGSDVADVPEVIVTVTTAVARRAFLNPEGYQQETADGHTVTMNGSIYLTDEEKALIASTVTTRAGLYTISTTRCGDELPDIYLDVVASEDIPHVPVGEINW